MATESDCTENVNTDDFITEIENWPAIWDLKNDDYSNKTAKRNAWEAVIGKFVPNFNELPEAEKKCKLGDGGSSEADMVVLHVGTNNLKTARCPEDVMGEIYCLIRPTKKRYPNSNINLNGVVLRRDINPKFISKTDHRIYLTNRSCVLKVFKGRKSAREKKEKKEKEKKKTQVAEDCLSSAQNVLSLPVKSSKFPSSILRRSGHREVAVEVKSKDFHKFSIEEDLHNCLLVVTGMLRQREPTRGGLRTQNSFVSLFWVEQ
ncbi:hypothetical protein J437_LFUL014353 [Ladona fulva]|uniref:MADF domain-containing protein n=1 Tax=Ladona fulva TaxID=123851 RepID=A0A8K0PD11_LADFU|nr:hypothetical protein J437_LFUL014353 [Ladona fulva]